VELPDIEAANRLAHKMHTASSASRTGLHTRTRKAV
jgi:hypothetical protein